MSVTPLRLALVASALLWIAATVVVIVSLETAAVAAMLVTTSVLIAVGIAVVLIRRLDGRVAALEARLVRLSQPPQKPKKLPSSEDDWAPRLPVDARTVAGIVAISGRVDLAGLLRLGSADHPALAETIATIDKTAPARITVVGAPAEAYALAVVSARGSRVPVTAILADEDAVDTLRGLSVDDDNGHVLDVTHLPYDGAGVGGGWTSRALAQVEPAGLVYVGGPPWSLGPDARHALVDRILSAAPAVTGVIVPEPRRLESQAMAERLRSGGFGLTNETLSTAFFEPVARHG